MTPHETASTITPGAPRATAPLTRTFGPQGPTLGDLSDAYLQDYQVRQFRSVSTARGRTAHLAVFFGRDAQGWHPSQCSMRSLRVVDLKPVLGDQSHLRQRLEDVGIHVPWQLDRLGNVAERNEPVSFTRHRFILQTYQMLN